jgi:hypothetical protein
MRRGDGIEIVDGMEMVEDGGQVVFYGTNRAAYAFTVTWPFDEVRVGVNAEILVLHGEAHMHRDCGGIACY